MLGEVDGLSSIVGFVLAIAILGVVVWLLGVDDVAAAFALVRPRFLAAVAVVALTWLFAWSLGLRTVLGMLDVHVTVPGAYLLQAAVQFANNVTPFGQAGGEPISALLISRSADAEYRTSLAAIASVDAINFLPSVLFATVGLGYYAVVFTLGPRLLQAALVVAGLVLAVGVTAYVAWRYRHRLEDVSVEAVTPVLRVVSRVVPFRDSPTREAVRSHVRGFYQDLGRLADRPDRLALALGFSCLGWLGLVGSLWLSLYSLGHVVPFPALMVVIPLGAIASIAPLPGGLGGIETVLILLLVPTTAVSPAVAGAAVLVHRTATYWLPIGVGGLAAAYLGTGVGIRS